MGNENGNDGNNAKSRFGKKVRKNISSKNVEIPIVFPRKVYSKLKSFAEENATDCFWLAFEKLLDFYNEQKAADVKYAMLYNELQELKFEFENLKQEQSEEKPQKRFGER